MVVALYCAIVLSGGCVLFLAALPFIHLPSPQAQRMLRLVKSTRVDTRSLRVWERAVAVLIHQAHRARKRLGISHDARLAKRLMEAGWRNAQVGDLFFAIQVLSLFMGVIIGGGCSDRRVVPMVFGGSLGVVAPNLWLIMKQKTRRKQIQRSIPDMLDLLVVCVGAGLGLDQALLRVGEELNLSHPQITAELGRVSLERQAGSSRLDAWRSMAERVHIEEFTAFTNMLSETDRFGTPIVKALSEFSDQLRVQRRQLAEEAAAKTKIKIIFPLVLCIFPCVFIVLLAPALLNMAKSFSSMNR